MMPEYSRFSDRVIPKHYQTGPATLFIDVSVHCCTVLSSYRSLAQDIHFNGGESGIRTHAPCRSSGFQDRPLITTWVSLHMVLHPGLEPGTTGL